MSEEEEFRKKKVWKRDRIAKTSVLSSFRFLCACELSVWLLIFGHLLQMKKVSR